MTRSAAEASGATASTNLIVDHRTPAIASRRS
jgi:hypothetical protein